MTNWSSADADRNLSDSEASSSLIILSNVTIDSRAPLDILLEDCATLEQLHVCVHTPLAVVNIKIWKNKQAAPTEKRIHSHGQYHHLCWSRSHQQYTCTKHMACPFVQMALMPTPHRSFPEWARPTSKHTSTRHSQTWMFWWVVGDCESPFFLSTCEALVSFRDVLRTVWDYSWEVMTSGMTFCCLTVDRYHLFGWISHVQISIHVVNMQRAISHELQQLQSGFCHLSCVCTQLLWTWVS